MSYGITVHQMAERDGRRTRVDIARITTAPTASEMEDMVTALHREYPAPHYQVEVWPYRPAYR